MSSILLRDYQLAALLNVQEEFHYGITQQLVELPTGSGKTIIMAEIAKHYNKKTLILSHREELIQQTYQKVKLVWSDADIGICKAERNEIDHQIVIGSVATCHKSKRLTQLKQQGFEVLIVDEAHHAAADSYKKIIEELGFTTNKNKLLVGFTATPERNDKKGLLDIFEKITFSRSISTLITAGYLSSVHGRKILTECSLDDIKTYKGDFIVQQLAHAVDIPSRNNFIVDKYIEHASGRKAVGFTVNIKHAQNLAAAFNNKGIASSAIWSDMPIQDRQKILQEFRDGKITVIFSCTILIEGFDEPSIECIIMARPTKSRPLYTQAIGRGLRLHPGKQDCLVLDFTDKYHKLDAIINLRSTIPDARIQDDGTDKKERLEENYRRVVNTPVKQIQDQIFNVLGNIKFMWTPLGDDEYSLMDDDGNEIIISPSGDGFIANVYVTSMYDHEIMNIVKEPLPLNYCTGVCEDFARRSMKVKFADVSESWMQNAYNVQPTPKQIERLERDQVDWKSMSKATAAYTIRNLNALQNKQRRFYNNDNQNYTATR